MGPGLGPLIELLFDSAILIDFLNQVPGSQQAIRGDRQLSVSIITWIEVLAGARTPESERTARELLSLCAIFPLSNEIAERAAALRRERRVKLRDAVIWATAQQHGLILVTRNTKDFPAGDPAILVPYRL